LIAQAQTEGMIFLTFDRVAARYDLEHVFCGR
jgi:hypothetical protein